MVTKCDRVVSKSVSDVPNHPLNENYCKFQSEWEYLAFQLVSFGYSLSVVIFFPLNLKHIVIVISKNILHKYGQTVKHENKIALAYIS